MNNWNFTGNLGKDCEIKQGQNGNRLVFSVAVTSGYGDNQKTTWANCVVFGKRADGNLPQHLKAGQKVAITGELTLEKWQDSQGNEKQALKVVVGSLDLIGGQQPAQPTPQQNYQQPAPQQQPRTNNQPNPQSPPPPAGPQNGRTVPPHNGFDDFDDDIPFANPYQHIYHIV
ncbi:MAG: hypothetical protein CMI54_01400 [Parcubacteria group bacterium]|nr:hypothetical protein [Parcubacteria group bacterium]|tara:strand:- start:1785 stop:2300 length:516 start_codon:yes stop_codon:yes gene_type:complete